MSVSFPKGAIPPDPHVVIPKLEDYIDVGALADGLPGAPGIVDRESKVKAWPMYANGIDPDAPEVIQLSGAGDCTCAAIGHFLAAATAFSGQVPGGAMFTDAAILGLYSAVSGYKLGDSSTDTGCKLQSVAQHMVSTGLTDTTGKVHKFAGYFAIGDYSNLELLKQVANTFGGVYLGVGVYAADVEATSNGQPWTLPAAGLNIGPDGVDHCVVLEYSAIGVADIEDNETVITMGIEQKMNQAWAVTNIGQAMGLITEDWIGKNGTSINGQSLKQLIADSRDVKG
jgi:hypothetical protein